MWLNIAENSEWVSGVRGSMQTLTMDNIVSPHRTLQATNSGTSVVDENTGTDIISLRTASNARLWPCWRDDLYST